VHPAVVVVEELVVVLEVVGGIVVVVVEELVVVLEVVGGIVVVVVEELVVVLLVVVSDVVVPCGIFCFIPSDSLTAQTT